MKSGGGIDSVSMKKYLAVMASTDCAILCKGGCEFHGSGYGQGRYTYECLKNCDVIAKIGIDNPKDEWKCTLHRMNEHFEEVQIESIFQSMEIAAKSDEEALKIFFSEVSRGDYWWDKSY